MNLRPYQQDSKDQIRALFSKGHKRVVLCKPTGAGKTVTFASISFDAVKRGNKVLVVVDRKELLDQAHSKLRAYGLRTSIISGGRYASRMAEAYVATVQTLTKRPVLNVDLIIVDECHKQTFDKLFEIPAYESVFCVGATATPVRTGKMTQLSDIYTDMVTPVTVSNLIDDGYLVSARTYAPDVKGLDLSGLASRGGDYTAGSLFSAFDKAELYAGVPEQYSRLSPDARAICFNVNVEHSKNTVSALRSAGVTADHADGSMTTKDRERVLARWRAGEFNVLCNCDLFTTGFDEPTIETVIVNRATKSLPLYLQMCGRGSRTSKGKAEFIIIDMGSNVLKHGLWQTDREYSLSHTYKGGGGAAPVKECPQCDSYLPASAKVCSFCDYAFPVEEKELKMGEFSEAVGSKHPMPEGLEDMRLRDCTIEQLEEVRVWREYKIGWLIHQVNTRDDITLEDLAKMKGYKPGWVYRTRSRLLT